MNKALWKIFGQMSAQDEGNGSHAAPDQILSALRRHRLAGDMRAFGQLFIARSVYAFKSEFLCARLRDEMIRCCREKPEELVAAAQSFVQECLDSPTDAQNKRRLEFVEEFARVATGVETDLSVRLWGRRFAPYTTPRTKTDAFIACLRATALPLQGNVWSAVPREDLQMTLPPFVEKAVEDLVCENKEKRVLAYRDLCHLMRLPDYTALDGVGGFVQKGGLFGAVVIYGLGAEKGVGYAYGLPQGDVWLNDEDYLTERLEQKERLRSHCAGCSSKELAHLISAFKVQAREDLTRAYDRNELLSTEIKALAPEDSVLHPSAQPRGAPPLALYL